MRAGGTNDKRSVALLDKATNGLTNAAINHRINWTGAALTTFYAAVRKALVVVLVLRAIGIFVGLGLGLWWVFR